MKPEIKSKPFQMRMRPGIKAAGERYCIDQNRSLNSLLELLLIEHLKAKGYWPPTEDVAHRPAPKAKKK